MTNCQNFFASARTSWGGGTFIARSLVLLLMGLWAPDIFAQSESIPVSFTLEAPQPTCSVAKLKDINFGVLGRPPPGGSSPYGHAMLDERFDGDELLAWDGITDIDGSTRTVGKLKITAGNANTLTITWGFPSKLVMVGGDHEIEYHKSHPAHSRDEDASVWPRMGLGDVLTFPFRGVEAAGTHYFQIGGDIFIYPDTPPGHYTNTMTVSVSCPE